MNGSKKKQTPAGSKIAKTKHAKNKREKKEPDTEDAERVWTGER